MTVKRGALSRATDKKTARRKDGATAASPDVLAVSTSQAAAMLGVAAGTLANWRHDPAGPRGPKFARVGGHVVYPVAELERYLDESTVK